MKPFIHRILVIVPCFNEAARLKPEVFLHSAKGSEAALHFLFVNDGSLDNTGEIIQKMHHQIPEKIEFINLKQNVGKAEAIRQGVQFGLEKRNFDFIGFLDADLASPPEEISYLISYSNFHGGGHEFIFGSRLKLLGCQIERIPVRHYFGRIAATAASFALSLPVYDTQCGVKLFSVNICEPLFKNPFLSRWLFDVEIFFRAKGLFSKEEFDRKVLEVPIRNWKEVKGTKLKKSDILRVPLELLRIRRFYANRSNF